MSSISGRTPLDTGESTVLLDMEELALPYMIGNVTSDPQLARAVMRGGASGPGNLGSSTLWNTDKSGGMASLYANAFIIQPGNTNVLPRTDSGAAYTLRSAMCPVPMGYNPTLDGSMASVPYATKTIVETNVLRSNTVSPSGISRLQLPICSQLQTAVSDSVCTLLAVLVRSLPSRCVATVRTTDRLRW